MLGNYFAYFSGGFRKILNPEPTTVHPKPRPLLKLLLGCGALQLASSRALKLNIGALIIRIGFRGPYYTILTIRTPPPKKIALVII